MNAYRYGNAVANYVQYLASPSEGSSSDTYEITNLSTTWSQAYYGMSDAHDMIVGAEESGADLHAGVVKLLSAYQLGLVADAWGTASYTYAFHKVENFSAVSDTPDPLYAFIGNTITMAPPA